MAPERTSGLNVNHLKNVPNILTSIPSAPSPFPSSNVQSGNPPPLPPRRAVQNYSEFTNNQPFGSNYYGGYGFGYGNQYRGLNGYGGYGGFSSFGPYSNYNNYGTFSGHSGDSESRFYQYVEESTRPTFQLIETVLHTFSSMTMLLESTYFALTNSFKAILSVAENFGKLRSTINQLFSTFALIRFIKWLYRKIIRSTGFQDQNSINDKLWDKSLSKIGGENVHNSSFWSGFLVLSVFFVIPYMIHKISSNIKQMQMKGSDPKEWHQCEEPAYIATVLYDFVASNNDELSVKAGQKVCLAPRSLQPKNLPGWCRATDNINVGLIPYNYVKVIGQLKKVKKNNEISPLNGDKSSTSENQHCSNKTNFDTVKNNETTEN
ncbi:Peroxisomal membrane protein PEX13 [Habropoda laboriosa]|uniref:Peroxisomal membrane protein PEX13 n=1 Tax=Habropoda laboriosa TaxID=597456 RepID=A0A0L7RGW8_9HYME|nr:PREDICTED: peroxisomal membrane protein PEX13 [Habropoda laboriosa]KOC70222.1 Peroxisomal membrane protein PEX13 [Habropoda laboriosa]